MAERSSNIKPNAVTAILIAVVPAVLLFLIQFVDSQRKDQLTRVDAQLERLYGPLYALTTANDATWDKFSSTPWKHTRYIFSHKRTIQDVGTWRVWMKIVFEPLNEKMEDAIVTNSQLIIGDNMPRTFQALIAHTETYKVIISRWQLSDRQNETTYLSRESNVIGSQSYPVYIKACAEAGFKALKQRQQDLRLNFFSGIVPYVIATPDACNRVQSSGDI